MSTHRVGWKRRPLLDRVVTRLAERQWHPDLSIKWHPPVWLGKARPGAGKLYAKVVTEQPAKRRSRRAVPRKMQEV